MTRCVVTAQRRVQGLQSLIVLYAHHRHHMYTLYNT